MSFKKLLERNKDTATETVYSPSDYASFASLERLQDIQPETIGYLIEEDLDLIAGVEGVDPMDVWILVQDYEADISSGKC